MYKLIVTMTDIQRYKVLKEVLDKRISLKDASEILSVSYRQSIQHRWLEHISEKWWLIAMIDDAVTFEISNNSHRIA